MDGGSDKVKGDSGEFEGVSDTVYRDCDEGDCLKVEWDSDEDEGVSSVAEIPDE